MPPEINRGYPFPDGTIHKEAQLLGPYPVWNNWKHQIVKEFGEIWENGDGKIEELMHDFYIIRRLAQKRKSIDAEEVLKFWSEAEGLYPGFEEKYGEVISFIVKKTPVDSPVKTRK